MAHNSVVLHSCWWTRKWETKTSGQALKYRYLVWNAFDSYLLDTQANDHKENIFGFNVYPLYAEELVYYS